MKFWMAALALVLACGFVGTAQAAKKVKSDKPLKATFVSVKPDGSSIDVTTGKKDALQTVTVTLAANVSVTLDGAPSDIKSIPVGAKLEISPSTGSATSIVAKSKNHKKKGV